MRRDKLFGNKFMRLAACALMAFACAGEVWGVGGMEYRISPISKEYQKWEKEQQYKKMQKPKMAGYSRRSKGRILSASSEEDLSRGFGYVPSLFDRSYLKNVNMLQVGDSRSARVSQTTLPPYYHLGELSPSRLTSIKNQGRYGTCWAHATYASLESLTLKNTGVALNYSEKHLVGTHGFDWGFDEGGNDSMATAYLTRWAGPIAESEDPYPDNSYMYTWEADYNAWKKAQKEGRAYKRQYDKVDELIPPSPQGTVLGHVQNVRWIAPMKDAKDTSAIKRAVMEYGAVYVNYFINGNDELPSGDYYYNGVTSLDPDRYGWHAVAIVGWDDGYSKDNFYQKPKGNGAWIIKNSWGESSGDNGYWHISYYDMYCGRKAVTAFCSLESVDNYSHLYQYDPLGLVATYPTGTTKFYGANIFTAKEQEELAAVGFYAIVPNTQYTIRIYTGCTAATEETGQIYGDWPISGNCKLTQSGTTDFAGFVTIPLDDTVAVTVGEKFSIVLYVYTPDIDIEEKGPLAVEYAAVGSNGPYSTQATASPGESYFSKDGSNWFDARWVSGTLNFCCKAYTKGKAPIFLKSLLIKGSPVINSGETSQYECSAIYDNKARTSITPQWSIIKGDEYAEVSVDGTVKAYQVDADQNIVLQAEYYNICETMPILIAAKAPDVPQNLKASQGDDESCVSVSWDVSKGASVYGVFRSVTGESKNKEWQRDVSEPNFADKTAVPGKNYTYFITAKNSKVSELSKGVFGWRKLSSPEVTASDNLLDKVAVSWSEVEGATHYCVYRADDVDSEKRAISGWLIERTFDDVPPEKDVPYYYYVVAAVDASGNRPSDYSIVEDGMMVSPVTVDHLEIKGDANIAAGGYADYTADAIYTDGHRVENVTPDRWDIVGDGASVVNGRVTADVVTENKTVALKASYTEDGKTARGEKEIAIVAVKPNAPRNVTAVAVATSATLPGRIEIAWSAVAGAAQYVVYRDGGVVGRVIPNAPGGVIETTFSDSTAIPGVTYSYTVSAANGAGEGPQSSSVSATIPLPAPTGVTATSDRTDGVLVDWRRVRDNAPYQSGTYYFRVARATSEAGVKTELGSWTTDLTYLDAASPVNTPLYYFVRAATTSSGTNAGDWSVPVVGRVIPNAPTLLSISISGPDRVSASGTALYSCAASYDDNTEPTVSPRWSVSPSSAATIDPSGMLTASAVSSDTEVTVTAAYDGKTATKKVKVIAPVVTASASVSNVRVTPRWPFSTLVDIDYTLATAPVGTMAHITLSGQDNDHNLPLAARTLTGDGASGVVAAGERRITWNIGADYPNLHVKSLDVTLDALPHVISAPANFTASAGTSSYAVELAWDAVSGATGYEIWRSDSPSTATASNIVAVADGTTYSDTEANAMQPYFYWVKTVTEYGTSGFGDYVYGYRLPPVSGTVTLDPNGGTVSEASVSYTAGTAYGALPNAMRTGYNFVGWFTAKADGVEVTAATIADDKTSVLYAHWTPCEYFVRFSPNGGNGTMADMRVYYGITTNLSANTFSRDGCRFAGWATNENGGVVYVDGARVTPSTNMMLYASWAIPLQYALDNDGLSFTTGGNAEWLGVFDNSAVNGSAAKSGKITHSQSTWLRTTVVGKGTLSYRCKTSCESSFDKLTLTIDGRQYGTASGNGSGFNTLVYSVTNAGTHTVTWTYSKDSSVSQGDDCVWIDNVVWTPILFSASSGTSTDGIVLEWEPVADVSTYIVWRSDTTSRSDAVAVNMAGASATRYVDTSVTPGVQYHYWLQAYTTGGSLVDVGNAVVGWRNFTAPTNFTVTEGTYTNRVVMSFDAVEGAMFYEFYMSQTNDLATAQYIGYMYSTNSHVTAAYSAIDPGVCHYFWVRVLGVIPNGENYSLLGYGMMSESASGYIKKYYDVSFNPNGGEGTMPQQSVLIGTTTNLTLNCFTRSGYLFTGWATNSTGAVVYADGASITPTADMVLYAVWGLRAPLSVSATDATLTDEVRVTWSAVESATYYQVWRGTTSSVGSATQIGYNVTTTSYSDTTALVGTNYYYWVKAVCGSVVSSFSGSDVGRRMIAAPSGVTVATDSTGTNLVVSWSGAVSGAAKYEIWRATYTQTSGGSVTTSASLSRIATVDAIVPASGGGTSSSGLHVIYTPAHPRTSYTDHPNLSGNKFYRYQVKAVGGSNTSAASNYSEIRTYKNAGTYSLSLPLTANYSIAAVGGGGGGAQCAHSSLIGFNTAGGGSGAYYKGVLNLAKGSYKVNVGGAGAASVQNYSTWADADNGGQTKLAYSTGSSYLISAGGGGGGSVSGTSATGGSGGAVSIGSSTTVVSTSSNVSGKVGDAQRQVASGSANGGASVYGGYGVGGNNVSDGGVGFFQIVINE